MQAWAGPPVPQLMLPDSWKVSAFSAAALVQHADVPVSYEGQNSREGGGSLLEKKASPPSAGDLALFGAAIEQLGCEEQPKDGGATPRMAETPGATEQPPAREGGAARQGNAPQCEMAHNSAQVEATKDMMGIGEEEAATHGALGDMGLALRAAPGIFTAQDQQLLTLLGSQVSPVLFFAAKGVPNMAEGSPDISPAGRSLLPILPLCYGQS